MYNNSKVFFLKFEFYMQYSYRNEYTVTVRIYNTIFTFLIKHTTPNQRSYPSLLPKNVDLVL